MTQRKINHAVESNKFQTILPYASQALSSQHTGVKYFNMPWLLFYYEPMDTVMGMPQLILLVKTVQASIYLPEGSPTPFRQLLYPLAVVFPEMDHQRHRLPNKQTV